ncbi:PRC-barrel domain-containing protein [Pedobacter sp. PWIIR3]
MMGKDKYTRLQPLSESDFQIAEGQPNLIGWEVKNEQGTFIGEVAELLFDPETNAVRYLIVDLTDNGMNLDDKKVMIPLGIAHLHDSDDEVTLPGLHVDQYQLLPEYGDEELSQELEIRIRSIIGSPAALRLEDTIEELDEQKFYDHHHFDRGRFYQRGGPNHTAGIDPAQRTEQREVIHELVRRSRHEKASDDQLEDFPGHS